MEISGQQRSRVWWRGALVSALKGILQGILLGALAGAVLFGLGIVFPALGIPAMFSTWLYSASAIAQGGAALTALSAFNPIPIIIFNTVLTTIGNLITGGKIAVGDYQQQVDHQANEVRIGQLEGRVQNIEQTTPDSRTSKLLQSIISRGPRRQGNFTESAEARDADAVSNSSQITH